MAIRDTSDDSRPPEDGLFVPTKSTNSGKVGSAPFSTDGRLNAAIEELQSVRTSRGRGAKPWRVLTYDGVLRIVRYEYVKKSEGDTEASGESVFSYQTRYSLNGRSSTVNLGRSDQVSFDQALKSAKELREKVNEKRLNLQLNRPLVNKVVKTKSKSAYTFKSVDDALAFLRIQHKKGMTYLAVYWQLAILFPILGSHIDRLRWGDLDLDKNLLRIQYFIEGEVANTLRLPIGKDISNLLRQWYSFHYRSSQEYIFMDLLEKSRSPKRLSYLGEELNREWGGYRLELRDIGLFWKRELVKVSHFSESFLDKVFSSSFFEKMPSTEDVIFVKMVLEKWWGVVDRSLIYPFDSPFSKPKQINNQQQGPTSGFDTKIGNDYVGMLANTSFGLKAYVSEKTSNKYNIEIARPIYDISSPNPVLNGAIKYLPSRTMRSLDKLPVYSFDEYGFTLKLELIAIILSSDLIDPRFKIEGKPGIFLTTKQAVGNPDNLTDTGYEIEFCDSESLKVPKGIQPHSLLKKAPLKTIPFVSGALSKATIQGKKFLYRISKVGDPLPIYVNVVDM
ncbi:hypothetical protein [Rhodoferax sp.]|uniref:hypothetical protein n=1 Tax=Rhodoferax sp. TaxID=50421 RepID=UPI0025D92448|nr:hypothetical protein [Rhodoferax sp.]